MDKILTVKEVSEYLKLHRSTIYYMIQRKQIPHIKIGKSVRIRESDLIKWIEEHMVQPKLEF